MRTRWTINGFPALIQLTFFFLTALVTPMMLPTTCPIKYRPIPPKGIALTEQDRSDLVVES